MQVIAVVVAAVLTGCLDGDSAAPPGEGGADASVATPSGAPGMDAPNGTDVHDLTTGREVHMAWPMGTAVGHAWVRFDEPFYLQGVTTRDPADSGEARGTHLGAWMVPAGATPCTDAPLVADNRLASADPTAYSAALQQQQAAGTYRLFVWNQVAAGDVVAFFQTNRSDEEIRLPVSDSGWALVEAQQVGGRNASFEPDPGLYATVLSPDSEITDMGDWETVLESGCRKLQQSGSQATALVDPPAWLHARVWMDAGAISSTYEHEAGDRDATLWWFGIRAPA